MLNSVSVNPRHLRRVLRDGRGLAALEFAVVGGIFLVALLGAVDMGRYYMYLHAVRHTTAEAARAAMLSPTCTLNSNVGNEARNIARAGFLGAQFNLTASCTPQDNGANSMVWTWQIESNAPFTWIIPIFGVGDSPIREITVFTYRRI